jgi:hypothetical protein
LQKNDAAMKRKADEEEAARLAKIKAEADARAKKLQKTAGDSASTASTADASTASTADTSTANE